MTKTIAPINSWLQFDIWICFDPCTLCSIVVSFFFVYSIFHQTRKKSNLIEWWYTIVRKVRKTEKNWGKLRKKQEPFQQRNAVVNRVLSYGSFNLMRFMKVVVCWLKHILMNWSKNEWKSMNYRRQKKGEKQKSNEIVMKSAHLSVERLPETLSLLTFGLVLVVLLPVRLSSFTFKRVSLISTKRMSPDCISASPSQETIIELHSASYLQFSGVWNSDSTELLCKIIFL